MPVWVRKIKMSLRKWRRRECCPEAGIPPDWQNTLVSKGSSLQRSSSSVSSFTSSSSRSSRSSSYSVSDFLKDLATSEELFSEQGSGEIKTSTPLSRATMQRLTRAWHLAGVKIYDEDREEEQVTRKSSLKKRQRYNSDNNLYENDEFLREIENLHSAENVDDGYEIINFCQ